MSKIINSYLNELNKVKQLWKIGDYFLVPLLDKTYSIGQIIGQEKDALNSVICIFFDSKVNSEHEAKKVIKKLSIEKVISSLFVTRDLLDSGKWKIIGNHQPSKINKFFDIKKMKSKGFVGTKIIGSDIVTKFLNAFYGLYPWDGFNDPNYLDSLLILPNKKPAKIILKNKLRR